MTRDDEDVRNAIRVAYRGALQRAKGLPFSLADVDVAAVDDRLTIAQVRAFFQAQAGEEFLVKQDSAGDWCIEAFSNPADWDDADCPSASAVTRGVV